ncbi:MAG: hypothetical protein A2Y33_07380 [Spirochaetes bacterium GWF1_51_8]|nr:MAG: hypothetical protein A2Y33_07380 [Spirochaetes bacterium GWF1_51_8]
MKIKDFLESEIRLKIISKANPKEIDKNGKHWKGYIYSDDILVLKVKIPNDHKRVMHQSKSQYIAKDLNLTEEEFNRFIECSFSSEDFKEKMKNLI